jgi:hypothetical protein
MQSSQLEFEGVKWRVATADRLQIRSCVFFFGNNTSSFSTSPSPLRDVARNSRTKNNSMSYGPLSVITSCYRFQLIA